MFLTNKAPYLAFLGGNETARAACLGVMNSLPFDWQARRYVEINLNFFILEALKIPEFDDETTPRSPGLPPDSQPSTSASLPSRRRSGCSTAGCREHAAAAAG